MNELTREASKRTGWTGSIRFPVLGQPKLTDEQKKRHQAKLDETRPLKGHFSDYLTGLEPYKQSGKHADIKPQPLHT